MFPHHFHTVFFGGETDIFCRKKVKVNCETYHHMVLLKEHEAEMCYMLGNCYSCGQHGHGVAKCPIKLDRGKLVCEMIRRGYCKCPCHHRNPNANIDSVDFDDGLSGTIDWKSEEDGWSVDRSSTWPRAKDEGRRGEWEAIQVAGPVLGDEEEEVRQWVANDGEKEWAVESNSQWAEVMPGEGAEMSDIKRWESDEAERLEEEEGRRQLDAEMWAAIEAMERKKEEDRIKIQRWLEIVGEMGRTQYLKMTAAREAAIESARRTREAEGKVREGLLSALGTPVNSLESLPDLVSVDSSSGESEKSSLWEMALPF